MKNIRSKFVKESLLDYETLANSLKENTTNAVKDLLSETVRDAYTKLLTEESEEDEDEYEVEEVDDTDSETTNDADKKETSKEEESSEEDLKEDELSDEDSESDEISTDDLSTDETPDEMESETSLEDEDGSDEQEWAEFDKYKVSDNEYDFSNAKDEEIVKVYKLLKDDDQVMVNVDKDTQKVELKDNETGAEYLIDLGSNNEISSDGNDAETDLDFNDNMNEQRIFEIVLNEYDSHVGYTDSYQSKDAMTTPNMDEPGENVNSWDAGVPKGKSKPWVGKDNTKPFDKNVNEEESEEQIEEANLSQSRWNDTHAVHNRVPAANDDAHRREGMQKTSKGAKYRPQGTSSIEESKKMMAKVNRILKENEELKNALTKFKTVLQEAAVTNINLGQIIKLISENSTTKEEKKEIISRFGNEAKTVEQSKSLYESISRELKKNNVNNNNININEDKQFTTNSSKMINETQIYQSKDLLNSLDLMHRLCK